MLFIKICWVIKHSLKINICLAHTSMSPLYIANSLWLILNDIGILWNARNGKLAHFEPATEAQWLESLSIHLVCLWLKLSPMSSCLTFAFCLQCSMQFTICFCHSTEHDLLPRWTATWGCCCCIMIEKLLGINLLKSLFDFPSVSLCAVANFDMACNRAHVIYL